MEGPGLNSGTVPASIPTHFVIDTNKAGYADLQVQVLVSVMKVISARFGPEFRKDCTD